MNIRPVEVMFPLEFEKTSELCGDFYYRYQRYQVGFSMALFYADTPLDETIFKAALRESDKLLYLQKNLCAMVFDMTTQDSGLKAVANILAQYEAKHFTQKFYTSFVSAEDFSNKNLMKSKLFALLNFAIKEDKNRQIIDDFYEL